MYDWSGVMEISDEEQPETLFECLPNGITIDTTEFSDRVEFHIGGAHCDCFAFVIHQ